MTDTDPARLPDPPTRRPGRAGRWLLVASLALNLLFVGLVAGGALRVWNAPRHGAMGPMSETAMLWRALPEAERRGAREAGPPRPEGREPRAARQAAQVAELRALLLAEPFDRAALEDRLTEAQTRSAERGTQALARMLDRIAAMPPAERAGVAERLSQPWRPGRE